MGGVLALLERNMSVVILFKCQLLIACAFYLATNGLFLAPLSHRCTAILASGAMGPRCTRCKETFKSMFSLVVTRSASAELSKELVVSKFVVIVDVELIWTVY